MAVDYASAVIGVFQFMALYCIINPRAGRKVYIFEKEYNLRKKFLIFPNCGIGFCFWAWHYLFANWYFLLLIAKCFGCFPDKKDKFAEWWESQWKMSFVGSDDEGYEAWITYKSNNGGQATDIEAPRRPANVEKEGARTFPEGTTFIKQKDGTYVPVGRQLLRM